MRSPSIKRPRKGTILPAEERPESSVADRVTYVGSPEHKKSPSFAGVPRPRADATICDPSFLGRQEELTGWLKTAIRNGAVGAPVEGDFPRYVWYQNHEGEVFIARLVNRGTGEYKGWQLHDREEWPLGLEEVYG